MRIPLSRTLSYHWQAGVVIGILSRMSNYNAQSIEVLSGLEPVRRRPGMYTDTQRPNHLIQEVVDNSVDEAMGGHCDRIEITLLTDGAFAWPTTAGVCRWISTQSMGCRGLS